MGVRFREAGKIYYFDARSLDLDVGNYVVVETSHGQEVGRVVIAPDQVIVSEIKETLKPIMRLAAPEDLERAEELKKGAKEQLAIARKQAHGAASAAREFAAVIVARVGPTRAQQRLF